MSKSKNKKKSKKPGSTKGPKSAKGSAKGSSKGASKTTTSTSSAASSASGSTNTSSSKGSSTSGSCSGSGCSSANTSSNNSSSKSNSKTQKSANSSKGGGSKKSAAATTSKKINFSLTAESVSDGNATVVEQNDEQLRMIVGLLEAINVDFVTPHIKDDLDRIQKLVLNIAYREADVKKKVISVHFTELQRAVIKTVCCDGEGASMPVTLNYPYVKLKFVPTRQPTGNTTKKKK